MDSGLERDSHSYGDIYGEQESPLLFDPLDYLDNSAMRLYFDTDSESRADVSLRDNDNIINTESTLAIESIEDNGVLTSPDYTISGSAVSSVAEPAEINQFSSTSTFIHVRHDIGQHRRSTRGIS